MNEKNKNNLKDFLDTLSYRKENGGGSGTGGGGVSSWNDLKDKPFGEEKDELIFFEVYVTPGGGGVGDETLYDTPPLIAGETYYIVYGDGTHDSSVALDLGQLDPSFLGTGTAGVQFSIPGSNAGVMVMFVPEGVTEYYPKTVMVISTSGISDKYFPLSLYRKGSLKKIDEKFLPESVRTPSWENLKDKPFSIEDREDIIWDGNTEGLEVDPLFGKYYRISDDPVTWDELIGTVITCRETESTTGLSGEVRGISLIDLGQRLGVYPERTIILYRSIGSCMSVVTNIELGDNVTLKKGFYVGDAFTSLSGIKKIKILDQKYTPNIKEGVTSWNDLKGMPMKSLVFDCLNYPFDLNKSVVYDLGAFLELDSLLFYRWDGVGVITNDKWDSYYNMYSHMIDTSSVPEDLRFTKEYAGEMHGFHVYYLDLTYGWTTDEITSIWKVVIISGQNEELGIPAGTYVSELITNNGVIGVENILLNLLGGYDSSDYAVFSIKQEKIIPLDEKYMPTLTSHSGKKFAISVNDDGTITTTEVTE